MIVKPALAERALKGCWLPGCASWFASSHSGSTHAAMCMPSHTPTLGTCGGHWELEGGRRQVPRGRSRLEAHKGGRVDGLPKLQLGTGDAKWAQFDQMS